MNYERDWKGAYEEESQTVSLIWAALGCKTYDESKPYSIWEHVQRLKAERDALAARCERLEEALALIGNRLNSMFTYDLSTEGAERRRNSLSIIEAILADKDKP